MEIWCHLIHIWPEIWAETFHIGKSWARQNSKIFHWNWSPSSRHDSSLSFIHKKSREFSFLLHRRGWGIVQMVHHFQLPNQQTQLFMEAQWFNDCTAWLHAEDLWHLCCAGVGWWPWWSLARLLIFGDFTSEESYTCSHTLFFVAELLGRGRIIGHDAPPVVPHWWRLASHHEGWIKTWWFSMFFFICLMNIHGLFFQPNRPGHPKWWLLSNIQIYWEILKKLKALLVRLVGGCGCCGCCFNPFNLRLWSYWTYRTWTSLRSLGYGSNRLALRERLESGETKTWLKAPPQKSRNHTGWLDAFISAEVCWTKYGLSYFF